MSRAVTSLFFRPIQHSILGKLGSTGTNLVSTSCDQNIMAASKGFSLGVVKKRFLGKSTFEQKATKSGYKLPNRQKNWRKARFLGFLIKVLLSFYRGGVDSAFQRHESKFTLFDQLNITTNIKSKINFRISPRKSSVVFGHLLQSPSEIFRNNRIVRNGRKLLNMLNKLRQNPLGSRKISIFSGQKPCTRII